MNLSEQSDKPYFEDVCYDRAYTPEGSFCDHYKRLNSQYNKYLVASFLFFAGSLATVSFIRSQNPLIAEFSLSGWTVCATAHTTIRNLKTLAKVWRFTITDESFSPRNPMRTPMKRRPIWKRSRICVRKCKSNFRTRKTE